VRVLDELVRRRAISGYTVERDAGYLEARHPTLTYRMYRDREGVRHARRLVAEMKAIGAGVTVAATAGNVRSHILRNAHITVTARFERERDLARALAVVRERYHAVGRDPVPAAGGCRTCASRGAGR
jgi:hypothetical protein